MIAAGVARALGDTGREGRCGAVGILYTPDAVSSYATGMMGRSGSPLLAKFDGQLLLAREQGEEELFA